MMTTALLLLALAAPGQEACGVPCTVEPHPIVCVPTVQTRTKTHVCYRCCEKTVCLTYKPKCDRCGECGKPRQVRVLIKRFVKEQVQEPKCEPVAPPGCPPAKPH